MNHSRYAFLDGIRGLAAILVLTRHTSDYWHFSFYRSYLAVDLFFILSGFVIAFAYDKKLQDKKIYLSQFVLIRLIRLYPVFLLSLTLCAAIALGKLLTSQQLTLTASIELLSVIVLTAIFSPSQQIGNSYLFPLNIPYWSLFFELISNFIYAAARQFLSTKVLTSVVVASGFLLGFATYRSGNMNIGFTWGTESIIAGFIRSIFGIFLGLLLFRYLEAFERHLSNKPSISWLGMLGILLVLCSPDAGDFNWIIDLVSVTLIFPTYVAFASQAKETRLQHLLLMLGSASYPIYVLHKPLGEFFGFIFKKNVGLYAPVSGLIFTIAIIVISVLIEKNFDIPLRRWLSRKLGPVNTTEELRRSERSE